MMSASNRTWLHRFAVLTALTTLGLVGMGGLVTSKGVGMAVPDWPTSYGYNMFALPISVWLTGGVFHEHTHRLWASLVGTLVVILTRWIGGKASRRPLAIIGASETAIGLLLLLLGEQWKGAGYFLSGIGDVVILASAVWVKNEACPKPLPALAWWAFVLVQLQGLLGGLRVVLDGQIVAGARLGTVFGIVHACLGQAFLVLLALIALRTSGRFGQREKAESSASLTSRFAVVATLLILLQLTIGATMRHQHAGLAIPDFPLAYGKLWPDTSAGAVATYNAQRVELTVANPITAFQIWLQMAHRALALGILLCVAAVALIGRQNPDRAMRRAAWLWFAMILAQAGLGAWTIWSNKAADVATAHVMLGALSLVTGALWCFIAFRRFEPQWETGLTAQATETTQPGTVFVPSAATATIE